MKRGETSLLPLEDAREAALFFVVGALCFLAALAALTVKSTYGAARAWTAEVEGEYTVSLSDAAPQDAQAATLLIQSIEGVDGARLLSEAEISVLLEPTAFVQHSPKISMVSPPVVLPQLLQET